LKLTNCAGFDLGRGRNFADSRRTKTISQNIALQHESGLFPPCIFREIAALQQFRGREPTCPQFFF
jgi:hypothetical protein